MKYFWTVLVLFIMQVQANAWTYHSVYDLQGKKVYEVQNASVEYYSGECVIIKDDKGYYFTFPNGKRSKYYVKLNKLIMSDNYFIAQLDDKGKKCEILNNSGKVVIKNLSDYLWALIYTQDNNIIAYNEKESIPYLIDVNGNKKQINEEQWQKEYELCEQRKDQFNLKPKLPKKYDNALKFKNYFVYQENGLWGVRDYSDKLILKPTFKNMIKIVDNYIYELDD